MAVVLRALARLPPVSSLGSRLTRRFFARTSLLETRPIRSKRSELTHPATRGQVMNPDLARRVPRRTGSAAPPKQSPAASARRPPQLSDSAGITRNIPRVTVEDIANIVSCPGSGYQTNRAFGSKPLRHVYPPDRPENESDLPKPQDTRSPTRWPEWQSTDQSTFIKDTRRNKCKRARLDDGGHHSHDGSVNASAHDHIRRRAHADITIRTRLPSEPCL